MHTKFHKDWFRDTEDNRGDMQTHRQYGELINLSFFLFFFFFKQGK
jgi:hypothetical protein